MEESSREGARDRERIVDAALGSQFPRLARIVGDEERRRLAAEFVRSRPFYTGGLGGLERLLPDFLSVALADDPRRGAWLGEFARLEGALGRALRVPREELALDSTRFELFAFDHRVDELLDELNGPGAWSPPRPVHVRLGVFIEPEGVRCAELCDDESNSRSA